MSLPITLVGVFLLLIVQVRLTAKCTYMVVLQAANDLLDFYSMHELIVIYIKLDRKLPRNKTQYLHKLIIGVIRIINHQKHSKYFFQSNIERGKTFFSLCNL